MANNRFQKGSGCYKCRICGKLTRSLGHGDCELLDICAYCYEEGALENSLQDKTITKEDFDKAIKDLKKQYNR